MPKLIMTALLASTALAMGSNAIAADTSYKAETSVDRGDRGSYERNTTIESNEGGVRAATEVNVDQDVDRDGNVEKTTTVEKTRDPKGLWNKQSEKVKETSRTIDGRTQVESERTVNGTTVSKTK